MSDERIGIPRLTTRSAQVWVAATAVCLLAVTAYVFVTQPENRWAVAVFFALMLVFGVLLVLRRIWVQPETGEVARRTLLGTRRVRLADASRLDLVNNRGGSLLLSVAGGSGGVYVPVLLLTDYVQKSQDARVLGLLADQIDQWAPQRHRVAEQLRRQAEYVATGGPAAKSPLASLVTNTVGNIAKGGGAASGTSLID